MKYKRDLSSPLAPTFSSAKRKKPKKKKKVQNLKEVIVPSVGRYSNEKQSIVKAKKKAKNFSKNENTGYAAKVTPKKVKTTTYKDGKKAKTTVVKTGKPVRMLDKKVRKKKNRKEIFSEAVGGKGNNAKKDVRQIKKQMRRAKKKY